MRSPQNIFFIFIFVFSAFFINCQVFDSDEKKELEISSKVQTYSVDELLNFDFNSSNENAGEKEEVARAFHECLEEISEEEKNKLLSLSNISVNLAESILESAITAQELDFTDSKNSMYKELRSAFNDLKIDGETVHDLAGFSEDDISIHGQKIVYAYELANFLVDNNLFDELTVLAEQLDVTLDIDSIKARIPASASTTMSRGILHNDGSDTFFDDSVIEGFDGSQLEHGDILLVRYPTLRSRVNGYWSHCGMFDKNKWIANGKDEWSHCVLSSDPGAILGSPSEGKYASDKPGYANYGPLASYTHSTGFAVLRVKNTSEENTGSVLDLGKEMFYDTSTPYFCPAWEALHIGDTSHDLTTKWTYCTKLVYTIWKLHGIDVDSDVMRWPVKGRGNLVGTDDIRGSCEDKYRTIRFKFFGWEWEKKEKIYSAQTELVVEALRD
ncbi:MAG: hypothetical protein GY754_12125 [bacterium]|nr:hypothetical protein [bacterium]